MIKERATGLVCIGMGLLAIAADRGIPLALAGALVALFGVLLVGVAAS
jgi:hypothetical protein